MIAKYILSKHNSHISVLFSLTGEASKLPQQDTGIKMDWFDLDQTGKSHHAPQGGISMNMVSESNHTKHIWPWTDANEILQQ